MSTKTIVRLAISMGALVLLVAQFASPRLRLEPVSLGLVGLAVLPWLSSVIESAKFGHLEVKFREVAREQSRQRTDLDMVLRFLVQSFVTADELVHLEKLGAGSPFPFVKSSSFEAELRRLLALGLIERRQGKGIRSLFDAGDDVRNHLEIGKRGTEYLEYRRSVTPPEE